MKIGTAFLAVASTASLACILACGGGGTAAPASIPPPSSYASRSPQQQSGPPGNAQNGPTDAIDAMERVAAAREADWSAVGLSDRVGDVSVEVISSGIEDVTTDRRRHRFKGLFVVRLRVANHDDKLRVHYSGWGAGGSAACVGEAEDDVGNVYSAYSVADGRLDGQALEQELYPRKAINDVIAFERPVDAASFLKLRLPAAAVGGSGTVRLRVPLSMASKRSIEQDVRKAKRDAAAPDIPTDSETAAAAKVSQAKALRAKGKDDLAKKYLREVVDQFPGTDAAVEAAELLR